MQRNLLLVAILLMSGAAVLHAQETSNDANPTYRPVSIRTGTITVPPIPGEPFSATAIIINKQPMTDGSVGTTRNVNLIGRDYRGRTHGEMRPRMPESFQGLPPLSEVHIFDPESRVQSVYMPATRIARRSLRPAPRQPNSNNGAQPDNHLVKVEDLGSNTIENIDVRGTRRTVTIPAQVNGRGADLTVVDEYWYSGELHVNLLLRHNDPQTGEQTVTLTDVKREEPPQEFFEVPQGYKIVDETPPADAPVARGAAMVNSQR